MLCQYPFVGPNIESHRKEDHLTEHNLSYNGITVKVKLTTLTRLPHHAVPGKPPHPNHDIAGSKPSPTSSFSAALVHAPEEGDSVHEGTGDPMNEDVFKKLDGAEDEQMTSVFAQSCWDEPLEDVNITTLRNTISTPDKQAFASFKRLRSMAREYYEEAIKIFPKIPVLIRGYIASSSPQYAALIRHTQALYFNYSLVKHKPFRRPQELKTS
ncbi:hypothetical protein EV368DRAFT_82030 [Lentinula lateritia]|nr:hypothetical protein EV368DRAFT_82030 [Lentinula lateritia]